MSTQVSAPELVLDPTDASWLGLSRPIEDWERDPGYEVAMHRALTEDLGPASDRILAKLANTSLIR